MKVEMTATEYVQYREMKVQLKKAKRREALLRAARDYFVVLEDANEPAALDYLVSYKDGNYDGKDLRDEIEYELDMDEDDGPLRLGEDE